METPYIVQVDERGTQRLCLADGRPIPAQIQSACFQTTEQARVGECTYEVSVYCSDERPYSVSSGCRIIDDFSIQMPDGTVCEFDRVVKVVRGEESTTAILYTTAKLKPTR